MAKFHYINRNGDTKEGDITLETYQQARRLHMSTAQLVNMQHPDADVERFGTAFKQGEQSVGIHTKANPDYGIMQSTLMGDILDGTCMQMAGEGLSGGGGVVAPSQQGDTPASRIFYPETVLQIMNEVLQGDDYTLEQRIWASMISSTEFINTAMFTQPLINIEAPKAERAAPIGQNQLPKTMVSITTSQYSKTVTTTSVGLQISEEATRRSAVDLVGIIFRQQMAGQAIADMWAQISEILSGNLDVGQSALAQVGMSTYDSVQAGDGTVTQRGWLKYLYDSGNSAVSIDSIICTIDTYLKIQDRTGRPLIFDPNTTGNNVGNLGSYGWNVEPNALNVSVGIPNVLIVPAGVVAEDIIMGFDSKTAMRRVINSSADYSATEAAILQRSQFYRVDSGSMVYRLFDTAFRVCDLNS